MFRLRTFEDWTDCSEIQKWPPRSSDLIFLDFHF